MIRSTSHSYSEVNTGKVTNLLAYLTEYRRMAGLIVDEIWDNGYSYINNNDDICKFDIKLMKYDLPSYLDYNYFKGSFFHYNHLPIEVNDVQDVLLSVNLIGREKHTLVVDVV